MLMLSLGTEQLCYGVYGSVNTIYTRINSSKGSLPFERTMAFKANKCLPLDFRITVFLGLLIITVCPTKQFQNYLMIFIS